MTTCKIRIYDGSVHGHPCPGKVTSDEYCEQHHPENVKARDQAAWTAYLADQAVAATEKERRDRIVTAVEKMADWMTDKPTDKFATLRRKLADAESDRDRAEAVLGEALARLAPQGSVSQRHMVNGEIIRHQVCGGCMAPLPGPHASSCLLAADLPRRALARLAALQECAKALTALCATSPTPSVMTERLPEWEAACTALAKLAAAEGR